MQWTFSILLSVRIVHAPIARDSPGLNRVVQSRRAERLIQRLVEEPGDLCARRLHRTQFVRAARKELGLVSVPVPLIRESRMRHPLRRSLDLGIVPALAAVCGHFHLANGSATGPCQASDLVETAARQLLSRGRERDNRFGSDLESQRSFLRLAIEMSVVV